MWRVSLKTQKRELKENPLFKENNQGKRSVFTRLKEFFTSVENGSIVLHTRSERNALANHISLWRDLMKRKHTSKFSTNLDLLYSSSLFVSYEDNGISLLHEVSTPSILSYMWRVRWMDSQTLDNYLSMVYFQLFFFCLTCEYFPLVEFAKVKCRLFFSHPNFFFFFKKCYTSLPKMKNNFGDLKSAPYKLIEFSPVIQSIFQN